MSEEELAEFKAFGKKPFASAYIGMVLVLNVLSI